MIEYFKWVFLNFDVGSAVIGMVVGVVMTWCAARDWYTSPMLTTIVRRVPMLEEMLRTPYMDRFVAEPDRLAKVRRIEWR